MSSGTQTPSALFQPGVSLLPEDFGERLKLVKEITGLSWEGLAVCLGVDIKQVLRWRNGGAMLALVRLATLVPEGLGELLHEDVIVIYRRRS